ncbi:DNA-3-methyladenine glycosylase family protein [Streptomyces hygroscopicus]|uniref:DNA-3-methyladenine glycosylase family protein n=1 Tax=Streptomyces hygroscopicus TaxID=1912 RepID=UPI000A46CACA
MTAVVLTPSGPFSLAASARFLEGFTPASYRGSADEVLRLAFPADDCHSTVAVAVRQEAADGGVGRVRAEFTVYSGTPTDSSDWSDSPTAPTSGVPGRSGGSGGGGYGGPGGGDGYGGPGHAYGEPGGASGYGRPGGSDESGRGGSYGEPGAPETSGGLGGGYGGPGHAYGEPGEASGYGTPGRPGGSGGSSRGGSYGEPGAPGTSGRLGGGYGEPGAYGEAGHADATGTGRSGGTVWTSQTSASGMYDAHDAHDAGAGATRPGEARRGGTRSGEPGLGDGWSDGPEPGALDPSAAVRAQLARILSLDVDGSGFPGLAAADPVVAGLMADYPGLRPVCFHSPYEAAAWAVIGHRVRMTQAAAVKARLAERYGRRVQIAGRTLYAFPTPPVLRTVTRAPGLTEVKIERLHALAEAADDGLLDAARLRAMPVDDALAALRALPGIGPFSAELILIRGAGHPDVFPRHEPRLRAAMANAYGLGATDSRDPRRLAGIADRWKPYRSWVALLLRARAERIGHCPS